jgi:hypothetical protein
MKKPNDVKRRNGHGMSDGFFFRFRGLIHRTTKEKVAEQEQIDLKMAKLGPDAAKPLSVAINRVVQWMQR